MKQSFALLIIGLFLLLPGLAGAQAFDTHHRINLALGWHSFYPENDENEGRIANQDGEPTEEEFAYLLDRGYDIEDFDGGTFELGYEYLFIHWFGLAANMGYYGGTRDYGFTLEGVEVETEIQVGVFHLDLMPRFHWQTRWTDLYGGPVIGLYSVKLAYDIQARYGSATYHEDDGDEDSAVGWGLDIGFELRISEHWGVAIEDRLTSAVLFTEKDDSDDWFNAGGNVFLIMGVLHL